MSFGKLTKSQLKELLPFYLNGSLSNAESRQIEAWLRQDSTARQEMANWREIQWAVSGQDESKPSSRAYKSLLDRIQSSPEQMTVSKRLNVQLAGIFGALCIMLVVLFGLWNAVAPGIALEWSLQGEGVSSFKIYRAKADQAQFELISEIPIHAGTDRYTFVDIHLLPGIDYIYRVEGVGLAGDPAVSKSVVSNSMAILPGQLAILLASLLVGFGSIALFSTLNHPFRENLGKTRFT